MPRQKGILGRAISFFILCAIALTGVNSSLAAPLGSKATLEMYTAAVDAQTVTELRHQGYDIAATRRTATGVEIDLVLWSNQKAKLEAQGIKLVAKTTKTGVTLSQAARMQAAAGYQVWKSFDEPGGFKDINYALAEQYPNLIALSVIGQTIQGRPIIALKVTENAKSVGDNSRPSVLFLSGQHAREWISPETNYRLLKYLLEQYTAGNGEIRELLKTRSVWFVLVYNADGYQYSFDTERLWRKNLRDVNGDSQITLGDGVDLNRNWPTRKWGYDNEGSSPDSSNDAYRGSAPGSEPETQALAGLIRRINFKFMIDYHSYGPLILYPFGFQVQTPSFDEPIFKALAGTDDKPAIEGYDPGLGADLYTTNGDSTDFAYSERGVLAFTVELGEGEPGAGFVFPDNEALVQAEFEKNLQFALDLVRSAKKPYAPQSHLGNTVQPFYINTFAQSYGGSQEVRGSVLRALEEPVYFKYQINNRSVQTQRAESATLGDRVGGIGDKYYQGIRGVVPDADRGDKVRVWFEAKDGTKSEAFTYSVRRDTGNPVLVVANEDYTGLSPIQTGGPSALKYYTAALRANGIKYDLYDVDANGRKAPDPVGVLKHYKLVIWETGSDIITREPEQLPGTASKLANDMMLAMRAYLNEGGKLIYAGKYAGLQYSANSYIFDPVNNAPCDPETGEPGCVALSDDFLQYYLGAYIYNDGAGIDVDGSVQPVAGLAAPFKGFEWAFEPQITSAPTHTASFIATSGLLPVTQFPQFRSRPGANYIRQSGAPFEPFDGAQYVISQQANQSYKRLTRTIDLSAATSGTLDFSVSRDTELDWDFVFVEAHTVGQDDWTTLPDANGHTSQDTGQSCFQIPLGDLHPWVTHYQTLSQDQLSCTPTGTTGVWNAATGRSSGWEQWSIDLTAYAGKQVEVSIAYVSDPGVQGLGVFLDKVAVTVGTTNEATSFESGLEGWTVTGPPVGSPGNANNFIISQGGIYPEGAIITTNDTIYFGFGIEDVAGSSDRKELIGRSVEYLLDKR